MEYITLFYTNLFGPPDDSFVSLNVDNAKKIPTKYSVIQIDKFALEEIKNVVFSMDKNKSPGSDGFTIEFYQNFWEMVKNDLNNILDGFHSGKDDLDRLNYGIITWSLRPKKLNRFKNLDLFAC